MGNQIQSHLYEQQNISKQQFYIISQYQQGQIIQSNTTNNQYFMRQLTFNNQQHLQQTIILLQNYKANQKNFNILTNLLNIQQKIVKNICGSIYQLHLISQFSELSINNQIQARKPENNYFDILDCYRIVIGCIKAIIQVQKQYKQNTILVKNQIINRVFVHPQRILLMAQGIIKLCSPLIVSPYDRLQHKHNCYYSPQKLTDFDFNEDQKSVIFQLGITLIHILTLKSCQDIYNGFQVMQDIINNKILQIWCLYSDSLLCQILTKMTQTVRQTRLTITQCVYLVNLAQQKLIQKQQELQKQIFNIKSSQNKFYTHRLQSSSVGLTKRKITDYNANNYCVNTYSRYKNNNSDGKLDLKSNKIINRNKSEGSNYELRIYSLKTQQNKQENESKILNQEQKNKQKQQNNKYNNIEINNNNINNNKILSLDYNNKQNYKPLSNIYNLQNTVVNNQSKQSLLIYQNKKSILSFKQINVNTSTNIYYDSQQNFKNTLQMINSGNFNYFGKNKIQQSFQYGHQLTEGIIPSFNQKSEPSFQDHQNNVNHDVQFSRKRTQFLKNANKNNIHNSHHKCALNLSPLNQQNLVENEIVATKFLRMGIKDSLGKTMSE